MDPLRLLLSLLFSRPLPLHLPLFLLLLLLLPSFLFLFFHLLTYSTPLGNLNVAEADFIDLPSLISDIYGSLVVRHAGPKR